MQCTLFAVGSTWLYRMLPCFPFQSINQFISRHSTEARATVRLCRIKEKCLKTDLKCVNGWSSSTVQWKRVPDFRSTTSATFGWNVQGYALALTLTRCNWTAAITVTPTTPHKVWRHPELRQPHRRRKPQGSGAGASASQPTPDCRDVCMIAPRSTL